MADDNNSLRSNSSVLVDGPSRAPARAMLKAVGFTDEDLSKPLIAVAHTWIEIMPCTAHLRDLAEHVKRGIRAAGATPIEFNTIAVCDGISMGTHGMRASLISREVIADSIELTVRGHLFDGVVAMSGCDKTIPATVMALQRLDLPSLMIYGGSIQPGRFGDQQVSIQDVFEAVGAHSAGKMKLEDLKRLEDVACPGVGACGGQFTANTMALASELLGISPMGSNSIPATDPKKPESAFQAGRLAVDLLKRRLKPSQIITKKAIENAIASVAMTGGSTNAVLHLLAIAHEAGIALDIDDFDRISSRTPLLADLKPGGKYLATEMYNAGGTPLIAKRLKEAGLLHEDEMTVTGRTIGVEADTARETAGPGGRASSRVADQTNRRPGNSERKPRARRMRHQGRRPRAHAASRTGARLQLRRRCVQSGRHAEDQGGRRRRHSLRRSARRTRNARDARRHGGPVGTGPRRIRRSADRRALLGRDARPDGRACRAGSGSRRADRGRPRRRRDHLRHRQAAARRRSHRRGNQDAVERLEGA